MPGDVRRDFVGPIPRERVIATRVRIPLIVNARIASS
jgi:hypothetical protein